MTKINDLKNAYTLILFFNVQRSDEICPHIETHSVFIEKLIEEALDEKYVTSFINLFPKCNVGELVGWQLVPFGKQAEGIFGKIFEA